jgi:hypothetical protein
MTIRELFILILPVFAVIAVGVALRRFRWIEEVSEPSLIRLVVNVCMPCLVFDTIVGNPALRAPGNLLLPPMAGFLTTVAGFAVAYLAARRIGLGDAKEVRTFALSAGVCNYSYLPFPILGGLWGAHAQGVMLVHNMGVDTAIWSVGMLVLTGASPLAGWRRLVTPMLASLFVSVAIDTAGVSEYVPGLVRSMAHALGVCAVPHRAPAPQRRDRGVRGQAPPHAGPHALPRALAPVLRGAEKGAGRRGGNARCRDPDHPRALLRRPAAHLRAGRPRDDLRGDLREPALDTRGARLCRRLLVLAFAPKCAILPV